METLMIRPWMVALFAGLLTLSPTNVYKICAWNAGTSRVDPWRIRTSAAVQQVSQTLRAWLAALVSPRGLAFACLAVLLAVMVAHLSAGHEAIAAIAVPIATLRANHAQLLREAEAFKRDGGFADDAARTSFDAKMVEVDAVAAQIRTAETEEPASVVPASSPVVAPRTAEQATGDERTRVLGIQSLVSAHRFEPSVAADLVTRGVTLEAARAHVLDQLVARDAGTAIGSRIRVGEDANDKWFRGAVNWLLVKGGSAELVARASKVDVSTFDPGEFRGMTLLDLARQTLERGGRTVRGLDKMRVVADALTLRSNITQSTSDFAILLENVMGKVLQAAYAVQPDSWRRFCATSTVSDFRAHTRYRMGTFGSLDSLNANGEFKNKQITDAEKASITATTKGNIINVSRQMIVNDDMGAFSRLLSMLGRAAALSVEVDVYALLALNSGDGPTMSDAHALFDNTYHLNKPTGAAITAAALDADRVAMASQRDKDGNEYLDLRPAILVVPVGLGGVARVINQSQYDPDTVANKSQMKPNIVVGLFRDIVDTPRVASTRRYLFADPAIAPVLEVAFLEGQSSPVLETQDGWRTDGAEMKVRFDYGVAAVDYRGAVSNAGQ